MTTAAPAAGMGDGLALALGAAALATAGLASLLRLALLRAVPARTLEPLPAGERRDRLEALLRHNEELALSAGLVQTAAQLLFAFALAALLFGARAAGPERFLIALVIAVPLVALVCEGLGRALAASPLGDRMLRSGLRAFHAVQLPLVPFVAAVLGTERRLRTLFDLPAAAPPRRVVEGLRDAIEDAGVLGELGETQRTIIENALVFADVDAAAIMSPRTEIVAIEKGSTLREACEQAAECSHSRLPVFHETLDAIIGVFSVRDGVQAAAERRLDSELVEQRMRPAWFVPETAHVSELLRGLRARKLEMAIVLDEYGGTAGLITISDILSELVGELYDEHDEDEPAPIRRIEDGVYDIDAATRVSDVNEELHLELPEVADYETIGGFVLAKVGRFPIAGESLDLDGAELTVTRASDRRVLEVRLSLPAAKSA